MEASYGIRQDPLETTLSQQEADRVLSDLVELLIHLDKAFLHYEELDSGGLELLRFGLGRKRVRSHELWDLIRTFAKMVLCQRNWFGQTPLQEAARRGKRYRIKDLLTISEYVANLPSGNLINAVDCEQDGNMALHLAARYGHLACVQELIQHPTCHVAVVNRYGH